jgi:hypothetical protein
MVAFRKLFPVLAIAGLLLGSAMTASAQQVPLTCIANAGVPPIVRAEGFTELVGDIVLTCTGGNASQPFLANFTIFLNTNITSRILTAPDPDLTEALLLIDEPGAPVTGFPTPGFCVSPDQDNNSANGLPVIGTGPSGPCGAFTTTLPYSTGTYNTFRGSQAAQGTNAIVWPGIPIQPPGTVSATRVFRFTNLRANAAGLGTSNTLIPTQIVAFISVSASQSLAINNPQQTVAYIQNGIQFDVRDCANDGDGDQALSQCVSTNSDLADDPASSGDATAGLRFREGFQTSFKARLSTGQEASLPGQVFNTESGFVRPEPELAGVGLADFGTRLAARFNNVPAGVRIFVTTQAVAAESTVTAQLISTDASGAGGVSGGTSVPVTGDAEISCPENADTVPATEVPITSGTGLAVWEVSGANSASVDTAFFYMAVAYRPNLPNNLPGLGQSTVSGNFAPFYAASNTTAATASATLPIPRFVDTPTSADTFNIDQCVTNLLFPFVTNQAGFDTGIAISNTSRDPFDSPNDRLQAGTCTLNYYGGTTGGGPAPAAQTSNANVEAGGQLLFVLSSGGNLGITGTPGFQGYIIAQCRFQFAHGFAFVTDGPIGQARVAEGYLALVMDEAIGSRTGSQSEVLAH